MCYNEFCFEIISASCCTFPDTSSPTIHFIYDDWKGNLLNMVGLILAVWNLLFVLDRWNCLVREVVIGSEPLICKFISTLSEPKPASTPSELLANLNLTRCCSGAARVMNLIDGWFARHQ